MQVAEGDVTVTVPEQPEAGVGDAVFFNPDMELNRDLTVATLAAFRERRRGGEKPAPATYLDAMAASGIRGVRAAAAGWDVTMADVDEDAIALCRENLGANDLDAEVVHRDANALLYERGARGAAFDVVDLDPFGTPMPFADAAFATTRDLVCVTATDTAPLCGAHFESGVRSYGAVPVTTEYHAEVGLRVLLSALARAAARHDVGVTPLLSHVSDHYVRTYLALDRTATAADETLRSLGFVHHCDGCLHRDHEYGLLSHPPATCPNCGAESVETAGPLYLDQPHDPSFVEAVRTRVGTGMGTATRADRLLARIRGELGLPTHYDQHELTERWGEPATPIEEFVAALRAAGHDAARTHYGGTTFETTASVAEIRAAAPSPEA
ncbi:MAG: tRNA (guanine(26)-N(2))-dimethyltransferase [Halobacteriaceae archaeon]